MILFEHQGAASRPRGARVWYTERRIVEEKASAAAFITQFMSMGGLGVIIGGGVLEEEALASV